MALFHGVPGFSQQSCRAEVPICPSSRAGLHLSPALLGAGPVGEGCAPCCPGPGRAVQGPARLQIQFCEEEQELLTLAVGRVGREERAATTTVNRQEIASRGVSACDSKWVSRFQNILFSTC